MLLLKEGNHFKIYEKLGAHLVSINGYAGVSFAIWAPKAQRVSVVGDFNGWDGRIHPMRRRMEAGIWEIFVPGVCEGAHYKFEVWNCSSRVFITLERLPLIRHLRIVLRKRWSSRMKFANTLLASRL